MNQSLNLSSYVPKIKDSGTFLLSSASDLMYKTKEVISSYVPQQILVNLILVFIGVLFFYIAGHITQKLMKIVLYVLGTVIFFGIIGNLLNII